jgi:hypothetical protein
MEVANILAFYDMTDNNYCRKKLMVLYNKAFYSGTYCKLVRFIHPSPVLVSKSRFRSSVAPYETQLLE